MDAILNKLGNQPDLKHVNGLFDALQKSKNLLAHTKGFERRRNCIECFILAIGTLKPKFTSIAFEGVQQLLREGLLPDEQTPQGESLAEQLLALFANIPSWREMPSTQCQSLTMLVQLISSAELPIRRADVLTAFETFESANGSAAVRPASRAALTQAISDVRPKLLAFFQMLNSYVQNRIANEEESSGAEENESATDVATLLGEFSAKMGSAVGDMAEPFSEQSSDKMGNGQPLLLPLDALFSVLSALDPPMIERHCIILDRLKNELAPLLIWQLRGSAKNTELSENASKGIGTQLMGTLKRAGAPFSRDCRAPSAAGVLSVAIALERAESARSFYQVVDQLLRLLSPLALSSSATELLPMLEELWRCALLSPPLTKRSEALRLAKRIIAHEHRFTQLIALSIASGKNAFWFALIECVEECGTAKDQRMVVDSFGVLATMFSTILNLFKSPCEEFNFEFCVDELFFAIETNEQNSEGNRNEQMSENNEQNVPFSTDFCREKAATLFSASFRALLRDLEKRVNGDSVGAHIEKFVVQICDKINKILCPVRKIRKIGGTKNEVENLAGRKTGIEEGGKSEAVGSGSAQSTPEDSSDEDGHRQGEGDGGRESGGREATRNSEGRSRVVTEMGLVEIVARFLLRTGDRAGPAEEQMNSTTGKDCTTFGQLVTRHLHAIAGNSSTFAVSRLLNLSALDSLLDQFTAPTGNANDKNAQRHGIGTLSNEIDNIKGRPSQSCQRMAFFRWLRSELRNCWSSFSRMFGILKQQIAPEAKNAIVDVLTILVPLSAELGMPFELHWVYQLIAEQMCALEHLRDSVKRSKAKRSGDSADQKAIRRFCGRNELMGVRVLLENAVGALRIAPKVSEGIVRCCQFIWELERWHFQMSKLAMDASMFEPLSNVGVPSQSGLVPVGAKVFGAAAAAAEPSCAEITRSMEDFLALIDRIFSPADSASLPLSSLCSLLSSVCTANENNLFYSDGLAPTESSAQLLQRLCQLVAGISSSSLIYKTMVWGQIRDHLVQCACNNSVPKEVNRRALDGVQEVIRALLRREWPNDQKQRETVLGWNALLFSAFPQIVGAESICGSETFLQVGQILLSFVVQSHELIGSGWNALFSTTQQIVRTTAAICKESEGQKCQLEALILDIFEKFLSISKPFVLLLAFSDFVDALTLFLTLSINDLSSSTSFDQLLPLLNRSEHILIDYLFTATIELSPEFAEMIDRKWEEKWQMINEWKEKVQKMGQEDYVNQLTDLRTVLSDQGVLERCPTTAKWLDDCGEGKGLGEARNPDCTWPISLQFGHISSVSPRKIVALHSFHLLLQLMKCTLNKDDINGAMSNHSALTLNLGDFLGEISTKFGIPFATFCFCAILSINVWHALALPLTASGVRSVKQLLVPLLSHPSVVSLLLSPSACTAVDQHSQQWRFSLQWLLLRLSVRCIAKGGTLSLVGCTLLRNLCALSTDCPHFAALCADAIWHSIHYTLFPVRMLISQFFVNSADFSSDLGKMHVSYRLGLNPMEVEEHVDKVHKLAKQVFQMEEQKRRRHLEGEEGDGAQQQGGEESANFPENFAYLFVFENGREECLVPQKLSLGVEELVDSLLGHQLLVQLMSERLNSEGFSTLHFKPAIVGPLLASLNATLAICEQFHLRPGLKILVQKLTGLPRPANLWQLFLPAMHILLRWHLRQVFCTENECKMKHIGRIEALLAQMICVRPSKRVVGEKDDQKGDKSGDGRTSEERMNPFVSNQQNKPVITLSESICGSFSAKELENKEEAETQSVVLSRLLDLFRSEVLNLLDKEDIERIRKMLANIELQMPTGKGESDGRRKELRETIERLEADC